MSRREPHNLPAANDGAKVFWKSLEDKANPADVQKRAESEFPYGLDEAKGAAVAASLVKLRRGKNDATAGATGNGGDDADNSTFGRRGFMFFAGAAAALFAEGCARRPVEKILPYSKAPEHLLPGVANHYATVRQYRGDAIGLVSYFVKLAVAGALLAVFETSIAKMRVFRVPDFLGAALMLGLLGTLLMFVWRSF